MDTSIDYRQMKQGDESQVFTFITDVFNQFVAPDFSKEGIEEFLKYIQPEALANHLESNHFGLLASVGPKVIGAILVRDYNHVALFFIDSQHQRKGVGKELFRKAMEQCKKHDAKLSHITVNASPSSVDAYNRLSFEATDKEQCVNGIRFVPMAMCPQHTRVG